MRKKSLDTETTGVDQLHGARPFFVSIADDAGEVRYWQWRVDPLDRTIVPETDEYDITTDLKEIITELQEVDVLALQNAPFDYKMLFALAADYGIAFDWNWDALNDTLFSAHLLRSNQLKDLTTLAMLDLDIDISNFEADIDRATNEARRYARSKHKDWRIAKKGLEDMPGAGDKCGRADMWLPREIAIRDGLPDDHEWHTVCRDYCNTDSGVTLPIHEVHLEKIRRRGLEAIYNTRRRLVRNVVLMERRGIPVNMLRLNDLERQFEAEAMEAESKCVNLAGNGTCIVCDGGGTIVRYKRVGAQTCDECGGTGVSKTLGNGLPAGGSTNALRRAVFENLGIKPAAKKNRKAKTETPSIDKASIEWWLADLPPKSRQYHFVKNLAAYRKRRTALSYMEGYRKFGVTMPAAWYPTGHYNPSGKQAWILLGPGLNATGTKTLRWSSKSPNEQNISKQEDFNIRDCFGPLPGREWWSLDAKNIELRIPAYESGEQALIDLFERPDDPPYYGSTHLLNFHTVYPDIWDKELDEVGFEKVGPHCKKKYAATWYQWCKNGGFCKQYGGQQALTDATFKRPGAYELIEARFEKLSTLNSWCIGYANRLGYIETIPDTTVDPDRGYPLWCTQTEYGGILPTVPLNYRTQGTACWIIMMAMLEAQAYFDELNDGIPRKNYQRDGYHVVMQIHDELVVDLPAKPDMGNAGIITELKHRLDKLGFNLVSPMPLTFGAEYHPEHWGKGVTFA